MKIYGLIGHPLSHSFSRQYFIEKFKNENISDVDYQNFSINSISQFNELILKHPNLFGLNVTSPFKQSIIPFLDKIDIIAQNVNAVNVIKIIRNSNNIVLNGYNTDVYGFNKTLSVHLEGKVKHALILGTGGAANAVAYVLNTMQIDYKFVSRSKIEEKNDVLLYSQLNKAVIEDSSLIVNASPVGVYPDIFEKPGIPYQFINNNHILFDLIYNPSETLFLKSGKRQGAKTINGMDMLKYQAEKAWEIFNL
jgi:shikimate dehydrogenase